MPMLDASIPEGALSPTAERDLLVKISDLLLEREGVDPTRKAPDGSPSEDARSPS